MHQSATTSSFDPSPRAASVGGSVETPNAFWPPAWDRCETDLPLRRADPSRLAPPIAQNLRSPDLATSGDPAASSGPARGAALSGAGSPGCPPQPQPAPNRLRGEVPPGNPASGQP